MEAEIGIIGGSGFYSLLEGAEQVDVETKYGRPSDRVSIGMMGGRKVAFIPRHGGSHTIPPHRVPYRANIEALNSLGVKEIIGTAACGSLKKSFEVGQIVFFDQMVNFAFGRDDTFFDVDKVVHASLADPYCGRLRATASETAAKLGIDYRDKGCVVVVNGPRFSTKAESSFFSAQGFDLINMTQYPEAALARERSLCYLGIGIVTDYDAGVIAKEGIAPVEYADVARIFSQNVGKVRSIVAALVKGLPMERTCSCKNAMDGAEVRV